MTKSLVIADIDGVVADCRHRLRYQAEKNYDEFYGVKMLDDSVIHNGREMLDRLGRGYLSTDRTTTVFLTGRPERTRTMTEMWLKVNYITNGGDEIFMRKDGDYRPSDTVKVEMVKALKKKFGKEWDEFDHIWFIDDDPKNCLAVWTSFPEIICVTYGADRMLSDSVK